MKPLYDKRWVKASMRIRAGELRGGSGSMEVVVIVLAIVSVLVAGGVLINVGIAGFTSIWTLALTKIMTMLF